MEFKLILVILLWTSEFWGLTVEAEDKKGNETIDGIFANRIEQLKTIFRINNEHLEQLNQISDNILNANVSANEIDTDTEWDHFEAPYEIRKNFPFYLSGYDEDGRPIWVAEFGKMNPRKIIEETPEQLILLKKYVEQAGYIVLKSLRDKSTPERPVTDGIVISDMDKLDIVLMAHYPTLSFLLDLARLYQPLIEKHLSVSLIVNTNAVALQMINLVRPVFGKIMERVEIFGTIKSKFAPHILKHCPRDQIPPWYGGSKNFKPVKVYG